MHLHLNLRNWTRVAVSACLLAGSSLAHAQAAPGEIPPGWVFQGTWHDGHWDGEWVPGGAPGMMPQPGSMQGQMQGPMPAYAPDRETRHMIERCRNYRHDDVAGGAIEHGMKRGRDHDCERFYRDHREYAPGYGQAGYGVPAGPYGMPPMGPYGQMPYGIAPMGYMMVPVMQPAQAPYTETKTVTTTYVSDRRVVGHRHHVAHRAHDKRVYTGS